MNGFVVYSDEFVVFHFLHVIKYRFCCYFNHYVFDITSDDLISELTKIYNMGIGFRLQRHCSMDNCWMCTSLDHSISIFWE